MDKVYCIDCEKEIEINGDEIIGGKLLKYKDLVLDEELFAYKCDDCHANNPSLTNFRKCEVYSRVVGYIRPVNQWNKGKKEEYLNRKTFKQ